MVRFQVKVITKDNFNHWSSLCGVVAHGGEFTRSSRHTTVLWSPLFQSVLHSRICAHTEFFLSSQLAPTGEHLDVPALTTVLSLCLAEGQLRGRIGSFFPLLEDQADKWETHLICAGVLGRGWTAESTCRAECGHQESMSVNRQPQICVLFLELCYSTEFSPFARVGSSEVAVPGASQSSSLVMCEYVVWWKSMQVCNCGNVCGCV
jgi:hypothetical protein